MVQNIFTGGVILSLVGAGWQELWAGQVNGRPDAPKSVATQDAKVEQFLLSLDQPGGE
jgi:hypothetical protein